MIQNATEQGRHAIPHPFGAWTPPRDFERGAWYPILMTNTLCFLLVAAALEIGGDAALRRGLIESGWAWLAVGGISLIAYGLVVNLNRSIAFGRLMGLYIAVFFVVSQMLSALFFAERPSLSVLCGGTLIVLGGLVIQVGGR